MVKKCFLYFCKSLSINDLGRWRNLLAINDLRRGGRRNLLSINDLRNLFFSEANGGYYQDEYNFT